jgi:hypothetical protein
MEPPSPEANEPDRHPWRAAVVIGLLTVAAGMFYSLALAPWVRHDPGWWISSDAWVNLAGAHRVADGGFARLYEATPLLVVTPLYPILLVPLALIGSHWKLTEGFPAEIRHPTMWPLYEAVIIATAILVLHAARQLLRATGVRSGLARVQAALVPVAIWPVGVLFGHGEDVLALALVLWGVTAHLRRRPVAAAMLFGAAVASKQWALLGVPLLVAVTPTERRRQVLGISLGIPAALVLLPLAADWSHASRALFGARSFPAAGHPALWMTSSARTVVGTPSRLGAFLVAGLVAWRLRGEPAAERLIAGFAVAFAGRLLFEPVAFSYYLGPGFAFLLLHERMTRWAVRRTLLAAPLFVLYFELHPYPWLWWLGAWTIVAVLAVPAVTELFRTDRPPKGRARRSLTGRASSPRWFAGSRWSPRRAAWLGRRGTRAPDRARS